jgi:hypothetical protein
MKRRLGKERGLVEASRELSITECDIVDKHNSRRCKPFVMRQVLASEGLGAKRAYLRITLGNVISFLVEVTSHKIILRWILERWDGVMWTELVWLRIGTGGELL